MKATIARLWRTNRLLVIAFAVAAAFSLFFAVRTTAFYIYWANHQNQAIEPWMTIGYISKSWQVDPDILRAAVELEPETRDRRPVGRIAAERGQSFADLVKAIEDAIEKEREERGNGGPINE